MRASLFGSLPLLVRWTKCLPRWTRPAAMPEKSRSLGWTAGVPSLAKHLKGAGLTDPDAFDKLNRLAEKIDGMDERQRDIFSGALDAESAGSLDDVLRVSDSLEAYTFVPMCGPMRSWADMSLLPASSMATDGFPKKRGRIWTLPKSARSILPATAAPILSAAM